MLERSVCLAALGIQQEFSHVDYLDQTQINNPDATNNRWM